MVYLRTFSNENYISIKRIEMADSLNNVEIYLKPFLGEELRQFIFNLHTKIVPQWSWFSQNYKHVESRGTLIINNA